MNQNVFDMSIERGTQSSAAKIRPNVEPHNCSIAFLQQAIYGSKVNSKHRYAKRFTIYKCHFIMHIFAATLNFNSLFETIYNMFA